MSCVDFGDQLLTYMLAYRWHSLHLCVSLIVAMNAAKQLGSIVVHNLRDVRDMMLASHDDMHRMGSIVNATSRDSFWSR